MRRTGTAVGERYSSYCETETFNASCPTDHVILMTHARYGRMQLSRCVRMDYGHIGCAADVIEAADWRCSGRRRCKVRVPDAEFAKNKPCPDDLKPYLEAAYVCVRGDSRYKSTTKSPKTNSPYMEVINVDYLKRAHDCHIGGIMLRRHFVHSPTIYTALCPLYCVSRCKTRIPTVAEIADRTVYDALINHHLDDNIVPYVRTSQQHKQHGNVIKKTRYSK